MSVRDWDAETGREVVRALKHVEGALLPILHAIQEKFGYVDAAAVPIIADELNLSRAEVHGVISFYHDFRKHAPGKHIVKICRAEACQAVGGRDSEAHVQERLNAGFHETSADGRYTLDAVIGDVLRQVVDQVSDIVQQGRCDQRRARAVPLGAQRALQRVLELRDALAIGLAAAAGEGRGNH